MVSECRSPGSSAKWIPKPHPQSWVISRAAKAHSHPSTISQTPKPHPRSGIILRTAKEHSHGRISLTVESYPQGRVFPYAAMQQFAVGVVGAGVGCPGYPGGRCQGKNESGMRVGA
jgi:hypothetical protein